jgi:hypothetical protein
VIAVWCCGSVSIDHWIWGVRTARRPSVPPSRWSWLESCFLTVLAGPNFRQGWPSFAGGPNYLPPQGAGFSLLPVHLGYD